MSSRQHSWRAAEILVISSCTGRKTRSPGDPQAVPAAELYCGEQHRRLMAGVHEYRRAREPAGPLGLRFVSAGLGLLDEHELVRSYDATFTGLRATEIARHAAALRLPAAVAEELKQPRALTILALGGAYLRACSLATTRPSSPLLALTSQSARRLLPPGCLTLTLFVEDTQRFHAGFVGLKGAVVAELLASLAREPSLIDSPAKLSESVHPGRY